MDWQLIGIIAIGAVALIGFFALGNARKPSQLADRKIQGLDVLKASPMPMADSDTIRRFVEVFKAEQ
jgi:hypothetical protein